MFWILIGAIAAGVILANFSSKSENPKCGARENTSVNTATEINNSNEQLGNCNMSQLFDDQIKEQKEQEKIQRRKEKLIRECDHHGGTCILMIPIE